MALGVLVRKVESFDGSKKIIEKAVYTTSGTPAVTDDETVGFQKGSQIVTSDKLYVCFDAAKGAATWTAQA